MRAPFLSGANLLFAMDRGMIAIATLDPTLMNAITLALTLAEIPCKAEISIVGCAPSK